LADDAGDKTEPPTPRRRNEARSQGQVARSQDLNAAVMLFAALIGFLMFGQTIWRTLLVVMHGGLSGDPDSDSALIFASQSLKDIGKAIAPFMLLTTVFGVLTVFAQTGWLFTFAPLKPKLDKLNPINGFKKFFSPHVLVQLVQNVAKLVLVLWVAWLAVRSMLQETMFAHTLDFMLVFPMASDLVLTLGLYLTLILFLLAIVDFTYQKYRHEKQLKMTKQEVKEEMKRMDGDPVMKRRRREVQMKLAAERAHQTVPTADVVVTNPTHYSVAIRYESGEMNAPKVVAKGVDFLAMRIREIAAESGVPIVEKPQLARMLYAEVEAGREIPEKFYRSVAEVLAYVYEMSGRHMGPNPVSVS
jgi:flagellar biosynthesis protein FlhB